ncbi:MAG: hypothetical protein RSA08_02860 [Clostridia bacterium]
MKIINRNEIEKKYDDNQYVWYACYGSNINSERFMYYIEGDKNEYYSSLDGCKDKSKPIEEKSYIFKCPIYFAGYSKRWDGGMAFLDYEHEGKSYGKIYKLKMNQFLDVLKQEQRCKLYDAIIYVDELDKLPIFTFTAAHKLDSIADPSYKYCEVIKKGLIDIFKDLNNDKIDEYIKQNM